MADGDMGGAGIDVGKPPGSPVGDDPRATRSHFAGVLQARSLLATPRSSSASLGPHDE